MIRLNEMILPSIINIAFPVPSYLGRRYCCWFYFFSCNCCNCVKTRRNSFRCSSQCLSNDTVSYRLPQRFDIIVELPYAFFVHVSFNFFYRLQATQALVTWLGTSLTARSTWTDGGKLEVLYSNVTRTLAADSKQLYGDNDDKDKKLRPDNSTADTKNTSEFKDAMDGDVERPPLAGSQSDQAKEEVDIALADLLAMEKLSAKYRQSGNLHAEEIVVDVFISNTRPNLTTTRRSLNGNQTATVSKG